MKVLLLIRKLHCVGIELHYIGVEDVDIAKERVVARVKQGVSDR